MTHLEALQNRALCIVTGQLVSTPLDALRKEANVNSYSTTSKQLILKAREKAFRNTDDHPKRIALNAHVPQRLQSRSNWCRKASELAMALPEALNHRQQTDHFTITPWVVDDSNNCTIHRSIPGISSRDNSINLKSQMSISHIDNFGADYIIYTDGSATARSTDGGFAVVVTQGSAQHPVTIATIRKRGRHFTSSLDEELAALTHVSQWVIDHYLSDTTILICTDSKSLCDAEEMSELTIFACYYMQSQLQSLSSGFQVIPTSLATSWQIEQQNKQQNCHLQQTSQSRYPALSKSSEIPFKMPLLHTIAQKRSTVTIAHLLMSSKLQKEPMKPYLQESAQVITQHFKFTYIV